MLPLLFSSSNALRKSIILYTTGRASWRAALPPRVVAVELQGLASVRRHVSTQDGSKKPVDEKDPPRQGKPDESELDRRYESLSVPIALPGSPGGQGGAGGGGLFRITSSPILDAALTTLVGIGIIFIGGVAYISWYKWNVLEKMEKAFDAGYDPALEIAKHAKKAGQSYDPDDDDGEHLYRQEQDQVDRIISGREKGRYYMFLGPKGAGKTTMIYDAMAKINAEGVAVCDAHPDLEVFRLRLGKALNFEFNEDSQTGLFQRRDPREAGPALDIERALNKLEKVALRRAKKTGKPLVFVFNNIHYFQHTDEGRNMLLQLQQRAESWAECRIMTMVFSSDDFWPYLVMRKSASRMSTISISDLKKNEALQAARRLRRSHFHLSGHTNEPLEDIDTFKHILSFLGGRLSFLSRVTKQTDMVEYAEQMMKKEKEWLLSQIGLIEDCDDDVMDEQKWSSCSWLLLREFVKRYDEHQEQLAAEGKETDEFFLPSVTYGEARQLMTRTDFMDDLDRNNIISIDVNYNVRPDSMLVFQAAKEVVEYPGFDEKLEAVRDRIDEIESLHRTRELTFKDVAAGDRIRLVVDKGGAQFIAG